MPEPIEQFIRWYDGPEGKRKWITDAESVHGFLARAYLAGYAARGVDNAAELPPTQRRADKAEAFRLAYSAGGSREPYEEQFQVSLPPQDLRYRPGQTAFQPDFIQHGTVTGRFGPVSPQMEPLPGPPPVTRIEDYTPVDPEQAHREAQRHVETQMMPALTDDTNPGFPVAGPSEPVRPATMPLKHVATVWQPDEAKLAAWTGPLPALEGDDATP